MRLLAVGYLSVGVIVGVVVASLITLSLPISSTRDHLVLSIPNPEVWASVLGAIVGGLISAFVAKQTYEKATKRELARDAAEREEIRKAAAFSLLLKLRRALDHVQKAHNYYRTFEESAVFKIYELGSDNEGDSLIAQIWSPLQGKKKEVNLGIEEQAFLLAEGAITLFNTISDIEGALSNCEFIEQKYVEFFSEFYKNQLASGSHRTSGKLVQSVGAQDDYGLLKATDALEKLRIALYSTLPLLYDGIDHATSFIEDRFGEKIAFQFDKSISGVASYA